MTESASSLGGARVLLVEDSPTQALRTRSDLERHGFCVTTVENGRKALDAATDQPPDVILSDVLMPEVDGFRLCLEARMDRRLRAIPIILRSSQFVASEDRGLARAAGADAYIQKDVSAEELADLIRATLIAAGDERVFFDPETFRSEYGARLLAKVVQDATELERINERLQENHARLQGLLDNAPVIIAMTDPDGRFVVVDAELEKLLGKSKDEIIGKTVRDLVPELADLVQANEQKVIATRSVLEFEEQMITDGELRHFTSIRFPLIADDGTIQGLGTITTDDTDRKRLERELRDLQKMEAVGLLAGGVAHDFGNFLSVIITYASFLEEEIAPDDPRSSDLREIQKAASQAKNLARQLMTLSRHESVVPEVIDLNEVISEMAQLLSIATGNAVTVEVDLAEDLLPINVNPGHLEQVLMNLAVNARDAMPSGGSLVIGTSRLENVRAPTDVSDRSSTQFVHLRVSDTGQGMDEATMGRIFDPFYTTKSRKNGTGLGLATVKKVIESVGGTISVESALGRGTTFDIFLPAAVEPQDRGDMSGHLDLSAEGQTVLVVDDDNSVRERLEKILTDFGYKTLIAATADEARELFRRTEGTTQLIVADVFLPGMSGPELAVELKEATPSMKVIFTSTLSNAPFADGLIDESTAFLPKPIRSNELRAALTNLLGDKEARDRAE